MELVSSLLRFITFVKYNISNDYNLLCAYVFCTQLWFINILVLVFFFCNRSGDAKYGGATKGFALALAVVKKKNIELQNKIEYLEQQIKVT